MKSMGEIINRAKSSVSGAVKPRVAVAAAGDEAVLHAVEDARREGLADFILIGEKSEIEKAAAAVGADLARYETVFERGITAAAASAVAHVRNGDADFLMKGLLDTSVILKAALDKEAGIRAGRLMSHVGVMESPYYHKLLIVTDSAINIAPTLQDKVDIIKNALSCAAAIGVETPKVAVLAAVEKVNPEKMPCTLDAAVLTQMNRRGQIPSCVVDGPLALDNAVSAEAARVKKIESPVAGDADILLAPDIEAGNILYKCLVDIGGSKAAGVVLGAGAPIVLTSRADDSTTKLASIALGILIARSGFE